MKDIKDYIHLYFGQKFQYKGNIYTITRIDDLVRGSRISDAGFEKWNECEPEKCKLILRCLSDMTEEEAFKLAEIYSGAVLIKRTTGTVGNFFYFFCEFRSGYKGTSETLIIHNGEAWYQHYFEDMPRRRTGRRNIVNQFEATHYLLKQGFDLFSLIENNLAIDAKTLK